MKLSLVICTKDRADRLQPCLNAVRMMAKPLGFELVLVDNASSDQTAEVLRAFAQSVDFDVRVVTEPVSGLARARNTGWRASSGDIVAFTDDDCYVASDYAPKVAKLFDENTIDYFAGRIELHDPDDYPITVLLEDNEIRFRPRQFLYAGQVQGANFGFSRKALERSGGFDERMGAGTPFPAEDIEMAGRISAAGGRGIYSPGPVVAHHHGRKAGPAVKKLTRDYDDGRGAYYAAMMRQPGMRMRTLLAWTGKSIGRHPVCVWREIRSAMRYRRQTGGN